MEAVHRPPPDGDPARRERPPAPAARRPVVAAGVVLLAWGGWLLVPHEARLDLLGAPAPTGPTGPAAALAAGTDADEASRGLPDPAPAVGPSAGPAPSVEPSTAPSTPPTTAPAAVATAAVAPVPTPTPSAGPVEVPQAGDGTFVLAPGTGEQVGEGELVRYTVEVEGGVPLDAAAVAVEVEAVLADPRSWTGQGRWALQRVDADPDARIVITSPDTSDRLCAPLRTRGELSCRNGDDIVLNADRWTLGARSWGDDVAGYRQYLVNHELGHFLGNGHLPCPEQGTPAPVMLQQTLGLQGCAPNAWPYP